MQHSTRVVLETCFLMVVLAPLAPAQRPPIAPVQSIEDEHWGVTVNDPYRYMEDLENPVVQEWIRAQADFATAVLKKIPHREDLVERIHELDAGSPYRIFSIELMPDGGLFYKKQAADENLSKLYHRDKLDGEEQLLIDPSTFEAPTGGYYALNFYEPSPDGRRICYGIAPSGSEKITLHVYDLDSGQNLPDSIDRIEPYYTPPQWLPDGSGFFYSRLRLLPAEAPATEAYRRSRSFLHRLGQSCENDAVAFGMDIWPEVDMTEDDFPSIVVPPHSDYVIGKIKHGDANQLTLYAAPLASLDKDEAHWKLICDVPDSVTDFAVHGDKIFLLTSHKAPRFKIVRTQLSDPEFARAEDVISASASVVKSFRESKDALYVRIYSHGQSRIVRVDFETETPETLKLPDNATTGYVIAADADVEGAYVSTVSWTNRGGTFVYDPKTGSFADTRLNPVGQFDKIPGYESVEVEVPSHDGVLVPLSIVYKTGIPKDGNNPTLLTGYGAYGFSREVHFSPTRLAWLERGGIMAIAHVRGGGEYGQEWHLAGQKLTKHNTWEDFIACAEYLIDKGYTSPQKLAGQGGSAGGILIGRAITERPDLFGAALINVGSLDAIRAETTTNGIPNIQEFGTVADEDEFHALLAMSSYHHVADGEKYPAVMLLHGINDPRVEPWMSAKMCARLQAATASDKPVLFRVDYQAGHGIGSRKKQYLGQLADEMSFLFWQLGAEEFQP